jgi:hypothetical protein
MKLNDNLAIGLKLSASNIPKAGVGVFTTSTVMAGVPMCEYKGDKLLRGQVSERYTIGLDLPEGVGSVPIYSLKHPTAKAKGTDGKQLDIYIDCHPERSIEEIGLGGFINDKYNFKNRPKKPKWWSDSPQPIEGQRNWYEPSRKKIKFLIQKGYNVYYWPVPLQPYFMLLSLRKIETGEELYVDYGDAYWKAWENQVELPNNVTKAIEDSKPNSPVILK